MSSMKARSGLALLFTSFAFAGGQPAVGRNSPLTLDPPRLTIADAAQDGSWAISGFRATQVARDGGLLIASGSEIHRFTSAGKHSGVLSRSGKGPGEFTQISALAECPDGGLVVADWVQRRLTHLPPRPASPTAIPFPLTVTNAVAPIACETGSVVFLDHSLNLGHPSPWPRGKLRQDTLLVLRAPASLTHLDTIGRMPSASSFDGLTQPFGSKAAWSANGLVVVLGQTSDSALLVVSRKSGRASTMVVRGLPAVLITSRMRDARVAQSEKSTPPTIWKAELKAAFENVPWPTHLPLWERVLVDDSSRVWAAEFRSPLEAVPRPSRWHVVDVNGRSLGTLDLQPEDELVAVRSNEAIIVHRAVDDTESLQVRRIRGF